MALLLTAAPVAEPIGVAEAKAHLRIDADDEDPLIASLIVTARTLVERTLGLALITQSWSHFGDAWPVEARVDLPLRPVQSINAVRLHRADGGVTALDAEHYSADLMSEPARVLLIGAMPAVALRPLNAFEIAFTAGYGDGAEDVLAPLRHALLLLVAHWFERREPVMLDATPQVVPGTVAALLQPYRRFQL